MNVENTVRNCAFIDANNLHLGAKSQKIAIDYRRFRLYLRDKFNITQAFLFIGYDPVNTELYSELQSAGFILVFKPTITYVEDGHRTMKGNVDAELVLYAAAIEYHNYKKAVIVTSDGDFSCLARYLSQHRKLLKIITPTEKYSSLLKPYGRFILSLKNISRNIAA